MSFQTKYLCSCTKNLFVGLSKFCLPRPPVDSYTHMFLLIALSTYTDLIVYLWRHPTKTIELKSLVISYSDQKKKKNFFQIYAIFLLNENFSICLILCKSKNAVWAPHLLPFIYTPKIWNREKTKLCFFIITLKKWSFGSTT